MTEKELSALATKIVNKLMRLKTVEDFFKHLAKTDVANATDYENLDLTEEQDAIGEVARLMTLMNLFQEDEEYEKFFRAALKKFKVDSPADFKSEDEKKKFFDYVDKNYKGEKSD